MIYTAVVAMSAAVSLGVKIREARDSLGLTQPELAEKLETTWHSISRWERGKKAPTIPELEALAIVAGRPMEWFFITKTPREVTPLEALEVLRAFVIQSGSDNQGDQAGGGGGGAPNRSLDIDPPAGTKPGSHRPRKGQTKTQPAAGLPEGGRRRTPPPPAEAGSI